MFIYAVLTVVAVIMVSICLRVDNWRRDWTTNHAELNAASPDPELRPMELTTSPEQTRQRIEAWVQDQPRWSAGPTDSSEGIITMSLTRATTLMRFTDDVTVRLVPQGDGTRVEAESQSRVGKGDLGQNPRNLKELVRGLR